MCTAGNLVPGGTALNFSNLFNKLIITYKIRTIVWVLI